MSFRLVPIVLSALGDPNALPQPLPLPLSIGLLFRKQAHRSNIERRPTSLLIPLRMAKLGQCQWTSWKIADSAIWTKTVATIRQCSIIKVVYLVFINLASFHSVLRNLDSSFSFPTFLATASGASGRRCAACMQAISELGLTNRVFFLWPQIIKYRHEPCRFFLAPRGLSLVCEIYR